jgi:mannose/fructose/sorbose-specific phosphotransferase system IIA component
MVGIVLCSHSNFAQGLKDAVEMIAGPQEKLEAIGFDECTDLVDLSEQIKEISSQFTHGCIYVCDIINGTPFNACALAIAGTDNVILTGASIPMLIELVIKRQDGGLSINDLADSVVDSSASYVSKIVSEMFLDK